MNPWIELVQSTPKLYYTSSLSSKDNSSEKKRVIKMNLWVELVESTTKAILHIFTEFRVATDQIYPWVHYNNSFSSRKMSLELSGDV